MLVILKRSEGSRSDSRDSSLRFRITKSEHEFSKQIKRNDGRADGRVGEAGWGEARVDRRVYPTL